MLLLNLPVNQGNFSVDLISSISKVHAVWVDTFVFKRKDTLSIDCSAFSGLGTVRSARYSLSQRRLARRLEKCV